LCTRNRASATQLPADPLPPNAAAVPQSCSGTPGGPPGPRAYRRLRRAPSRNGGCRHPPAWRDPPLPAGPMWWGGGRILARRGRLVPRPSTRAPGAVRPRQRQRTHIRAGGRRCSSTPDATTLRLARRLGRVAGPPVQDDENGPAPCATRAGGSGSAAVVALGVCRSVGPWLWTPGDHHVCSPHSQGVR